MQLWNWLGDRILLRPHTWNATFQWERHNNLLVFLINIGTKPQNVYVSFWLLPEYRSRNNEIMVKITNYPLNKQTNPTPQTVFEIIRLASQHIFACSVHTHFDFLDANGRKSVQSKMYKTEVYGDLVPGCPLKCEYEKHAKIDNCLKYSY